MRPPWPLRRSVSLVILLAVGLRAAAAPSFWDRRPDEELVTALTAAMGDEELLAQVFLLGYLNEDAHPSAYVRGWVAGRHVGGVKIFPRNVTSLKQIAADIRDLQLVATKTGFGIPLLVATDQEGGWIRHIRFEASATPGNLAIGATGLPDDAYRTGRFLGLELRSLGINMNFAPTIDVYSNPRADVIGPRAFSSDPVSTAILGVAYFRGMQEAGLICTAKHYPGHGDADRDSHGSLPVIQVDQDTLWERDLLPYRFLIREGLPAIMSGHLSFPRILGDDTPSSLSPLMMTRFLRDRLGFQGIAVTDDLEMAGALRGKIDMTTASRMAIEAGNDAILLSHVPQAQELAWNALLKEMKAKPAFRARVKESAGRILRVKLRYFKGANAFPLIPDPDTAVASIPAPGADEFFLDQSMRSVTPVRASGYPYQPAPGERVLIVSPYAAFLEEGKRRYPTADTLDLDEVTSPFVRVPALAAGYDAVIFHLSASELDLTTSSLLRRLRDYRGKLLVISSFSPVYLDDVAWVKSALAVYGDSRDSFRAGFAVLAGDFAPLGKLPLGFMSGGG
jgi:beta-N-acetylhexosaminidase